MLFLQLHFVRAHDHLWSCVRFPTRLEDYAWLDIFNGRWHERYPERRLIIHRPPMALQIILASNFHLHYITSNNNICSLVYYYMSLGWSMMPAWSETINELGAGKLKKNPGTCWTEMVLITIELVKSTCLCLWHLRADATLRIHQTACFSIIIVHHSYVTFIQLIAAHTL